MTLGAHDWEPRQWEVVIRGRIRAGLVIKLWKRVEAACLISVRRKGEELLG